MRRIGGFGIKMNDLPLAKVELLNRSRIALTPTNPNASYQYVYRAAMGVEWSNEMEKFFSPSDYMLEDRKDRSPLENMNCLINALKNEMGLHPVTTANTAWVGFDETQRTAVQRILDAQ